MYHGSKSNILWRFPVTDTSNDCEEADDSSDSAIIIELSPILRTDLKTSTCYDYSQQIYYYLLELGKNLSRADIICDRYFEQSLKTQTRCKRGFGNELKFADLTPFPQNFRDNLLKNSCNKEKLNTYLAQKCMDFHQNNQKILTVTIGDTIYSNDHHIMSDQSIFHPFQIILTYFFLTYDK